MMKVWVSNGVLGPGRMSGSEMDSWAPETGLDSVFEDRDPGWRSGNWDAGLGSGWRSVPWREVSYVRSTSVSWNGGLDHRLRSRPEFWTGFRVRSLCSGMDFWDLA